MDNTEKILIVGGIAVAGYLAYSKMDEIKQAMAGIGGGGGGVSLSDLFGGITIGGATPGENLPLAGLGDAFASFKTAIESGMTGVKIDTTDALKTVKAGGGDLLSKLFGITGGIPGSLSDYWSAIKAPGGGTTIPAKSGVGILDFMANLLSGQYFREFGANLRACGKDIAEGIVSISPFGWGQVIGYKSYEGIGKYAMTGIAAVTGQIKAPEKIPLFSLGGYLDTLTKGISNVPPQSTHTGVSTKTPTSPISLARPPTATEIQSAIKAGTLKLPLDLSKAAVIKK